MNDDVELTRKPSSSWTYGLFLFSGNIPVVIDMLFVGEHLIDLLKNNNIDIKRRAVLTLYLKGLTLLVTCLE